MKLVHILALLCVLAAIVGIAALLARPAAREVSDRANADAARQAEEVIARALIAFYEDNGSFPRWQHATVTAETPAAAGGVDVLVSGGILPRSGGPGWLDGRSMKLSDQLIANAPDYPSKPGPDEPGWNGPYLASPPGADPWNRSYLVNIGLVTRESGAAAPATRFAVWVLSAGPNGIVDTPYRQPLDSASLRGDDVGVRVQ